MSSSSSDVTGNCGDRSVIKDVSGIASNQRKRTKIETTSPPATKETTSKGDGEMPFLTPPRCASIPSANTIKKEEIISSCKVNMLSSIQKEDNDSTTNEDTASSSLSRHQIRTLLLKEARGYDINNPTHTVGKKRADYVPWDDYFMAVSLLSAQRSKDPETQFGACIVNNENHIVGIGYNGFPRGCSDDCLPWASVYDEGKGREGNGANGNEKHDNSRNILHTKNPYVCPAEVNAILNKCCASVANCKMYIAHFPCNDSAKIIIQSRIREVVYLNNTQPDLDKYRASRIMFEMAGVKLRQYKPTKSSITLDFGPPQTTGDKSENDDGDNSGKEDKPGETTEAISNEQNDERKKYRDLMLKEAQYDPMNPFTTKRLNYLSWDDYFMAIAFLSAQRSKDPNTQVGACIVNSQRAIIGIGYNGFPRGCSDDYLPWSRKSDTSELHKKYPYVCHAEVNAILNKGSADVNGATLYVALFPCNDCAKVIIQAGIREVVYMRDIYHDTDQCRASRIMFSMAGVKTRQHSPADRKIPIHFCDIPNPTNE